MQITIQQIEAKRQDAFIAMYIDRHMDAKWFDEVERRAFQKFPMRLSKQTDQVPEDKKGPFIQGEPVRQELTKLAVDMAKHELKKREPKRSRKTLP